jgi:hypothetical protein
MFFGNTSLKAIIQKDVKNHRWSEEEEKFVECEPFDVYWVVPSPAKGITAKEGARVENDETDPAWSVIKDLATTRQRAEIEIDPGFDNDTPVTVKSIIPIND